MRALVSEPRFGRGPEPGLAARLVQLQERQRHTCRAMGETGQVPLLGECRRGPGPGRILALGGGDQILAELYRALDRRSGYLELAQRQQGEDASGAAGDQVVLQRPLLVVEARDDLPRALAQARLAQDRARARGAERDSELARVDTEPSRRRQLPGARERVLERPERRPPQLGFGPGGGVEELGEHQAHARRATVELRSEGGVGHHHPARPLVRHPPDPGAAASAPNRRRGDFATQARGGVEVGGRAHDVSS